MLQGEVWLKRLSNEADIELESSLQLWSAFTATLINHLTEGYSVLFPHIGFWSLQLKKEHLIGIPEPTHLIPPRLCLAISHQPATTEHISITEWSDILVSDTEINQNAVKKWLSFIPTLTQQLLDAQQKVHYPNIGELYAETDAIIFTEEQEFHEEINKAFSFFAPLAIEHLKSLDDLLHRPISLETALAPSVHKLIKPSDEIFDTCSQLSEAEQQLVDAPILGEQPSQDVAPKEECIEILDQKTESELQIADTTPIASKNTQTTSTRHSKLVYILLTTLFLCIIALLYMLLSQANKREIKSQTDHKPQKKEHIVSSSKKSDTINSSKQQRVSEDLVPSSNLETEETKTGSSIQKEAPKTLKTPQIVDNKKDVDISNTAEDIVIKIDDSLTSLALHKYGHKAFWVYIYEENRERIKNPHNIPVGTPLHLPPAKKYKIDPQNTNSIHQALILSKSIPSK